MVSSSYNPAICTLDEVQMTGYSGGSREISNLITGFSITQSMDTVSWSGYFNVLDKEGVLGSFPIRAEETLGIRMTCHDIATTLEFFAQVIRISDIVPDESSNGTMYKMHFVSVVTFQGSTRNVIKSYTETPEEIVRQVFDTYFARIGTGVTTDRDPRSRGARTLPYATKRYAITSDNQRNVYIQRTGNRLKTIIPNYPPAKAMQFLASRSYAGDDSPSQTFRFFETIENYYFTTDEFFIKEIEENRIIKLYYGPAGSLDPSKPYEQINRVESIRILSAGLDVETDIFSGAYRSKVTELDFNRRRVEYLNFDYSNTRYIDMSGNTRSLEDNPHTADFRNAFFTSENAKRFLVFKDFTGRDDSPSPVLHPNRYFGDIAVNRVSYYHHLNNTMLQASLKGRLDLRPGQIIDLDIKQLNVSGDATLDDKLAGRYMIKTTQHSAVNKEILSTNVLLVKFDWSGT